MRGMMAIASNTMQEHLRDKLLYNIVVFGLLMVGSSAMLSRLTIGESDRVILNVGLGSIHLFSTVIAIFLGIGLIGREIDRKTIHVVLAKPVPRYRLVLGKYVGLSVTLLLNLLMLTALLIAILWVMNVPITRSIFQALVLIYAEMAVVMGAALLCSTFTTVTLGAIFTLAFYVIGHCVTTLRMVMEKIGGVFHIGVTGLTYLLPDLERFNLKGHALYHMPLTSVDLTLLLGYSLVYTMCLLVVAATIFQRRDFV